MRAGLASAFLLGLTAVATAAPVGVTTRTFVDAARARTLVTEIWYPARTDGRDAPPRGRFLLVLLAHGLCGSRTNYEYLSTYLPRRGFAVAAPDFPGVDAAACGADGTPRDAESRLVEAT